MGETKGCGEGGPPTSYGQRGYGRGFGGPRFFRPKPVEVGKEYEVDITEVSRRGDGVARIQGFVIFVTGGKAGQKATVKVTNVANRFATAEIVSGSASSAASTEAAPEETSTEEAAEAPEE